MLKIYTTIVLMFSFLMLQAQDIILYKSGIEKKVKIISVNLSGNTITYKLYPTDSSSINFEDGLSSILKLKFANGTEQILNQNNSNDNANSNNGFVSSLLKNRSAGIGPLSSGMATLLKNRSAGIGLLSSGIAGLITGATLVGLSFQAVKELTRFNYYYDGGPYYKPTIIAGSIFMAFGGIFTIAGGAILANNPKQRNNSVFSYKIRASSIENNTAKISKKATPINGVSVALNFN